MKTRSLVSSREFGVVGELVGRGGQVLVAFGDHMFGAERAHVKPDGGSAGTTVIEEGDGAILGLRVFLKVSDVRHARGGFCVLGLFGFIESELAAWERLAVETELGVVDVIGGDGEDSDDGGVGDVLACDIDDALGGGVGVEGFLFFGGGGLICLVVLLVVFFVVGEGVGADGQERQKYRGRNEGGNAHGEVSGEEIKAKGQYRTCLQRWVRRAAI